MADMRDNVGMLELADGSYVMMVKVHESDDRMTALENKIEANRGLLQAILDKLTSGIPVKTVLTI